MIERYGEWEILRELGKGGQGTVYLARLAQKHWDFRGMEVEGTAGQLIHAFRKVLEIANHQWPTEEFQAECDSAAVSFLEAIGDALVSPELGALKLPGQRNEATPKRFRRECEMLKNHKHPHLLQLLDHDPDFSWFVAEFHPAGSIEEAWPGGTNPGKGSVLDSWRLLRPVVDAVATMHESGDVHRDVKAKNVFLASDGRLILGDPGLAKGRESENLTAPREVVASWQWAPPWTMYSRSNEPDLCHDVFALVKLLWALVAGRLDDGANEEFLFNERWSNPQFDLRILFPDDGAMRLLSERLFSRVLVERREDCQIKDARELLDAGDELVKEIRDSTCPRCRLCSMETPTYSSGPRKGLPLKISWPPVGGDTQHYRSLAVSRCSSCGLVLASSN